MAMRVYEIAKQCGMSSKDMLSILAKRGYIFATHMSFITPEAETFVAELLQEHASAKAKSSPKNRVASEKGAIESEKKVVGIVQPALQQAAQTQKLAAAITSHKVATKLAATQREASQKKATARGEAVSFVEPVHTPGLVIEPMTVAEFATRARQPLSEVIVALLKQGIVAAKYQMLTAEVIGKLAARYEVPVLQKGALPARDAASVSVLPTAAGEDVRQPVVVVMGHVDHGKTTLLDTIRKTRVAAREKGGITQHLGAYEAVTPHGVITFLDTPGHAAFSMIRVRGVRVADIAILVVAADDGIKPQTLEALRVATEAQIPIIVALNKIDKASTAQVEVVKRELAQRGLVAEDWGGQTIMVPISAKTGEGVDTLLQMISLQAQLMELSSSAKAAATGVVIESSMEKGLGPVGSIIVRQGKIRVGDYFVAGATEGKITVLIDAYGKRVQEMAASKPVRVVGFRALPAAGDLFEVVSHLSERKERQQAPSDHARALYNPEAREDVIRLVVKADTASSLEAIIGALSHSPEASHKSIHVIHQGVGPISETDIMRAAHADAYVYGLHVKVDANAYGIAQKHTVTVKLFDIIYALLNDIAALTPKQKPIEKVFKKIGEALVLKVFDIKNMGVIAGAQVKSGLFSRDGFVKIFRGKQKVAEGAIKSLQRDRKSVKEVHAGFECAFLVAGVQDWEVDDRVECYLETVVNK